MDRFDQLLFELVYIGQDTFEIFDNDLPTVFENEIGTIETTVNAIDHKRVFDLTLKVFDQTLLLASFEKNIALAFAATVEGPISNGCSNIEIF